MSFTRAISKAVWLFVVVVMLGRCSNAPEQYSQGTPAQPDAEKSKLYKAPTSQILLEPTLPGKQEGKDDEKARANSLKPILYGVGAAGVTFETTIKESQTLLSKPYASADNRFAYYEEIHIWWRRDAPRRPEMFLILPGYQGELQIGGRFGNVRLGHDFSAEFAQDDPEGKKFLKELFRTFEKIEDPNFDCLAQKLCSLETDQKNIIYTWNKMALRFSKDRKTLYIALLLKNAVKGKLDNPFDILKGQIDVMEGGKPVDTLKMGDTWGVLKEKLKTDADTTVTSSSFSKDFDGLTVLLTKSKFDRSYVEPTPEETWKTIGFYEGYTQPFKINGKYLEMSRENNKLTGLKLSDALPKPEDAVSVGSALEGADQLAFLEHFKTTLIEAMKADGDGVTMSRLIGKHKSDDFKRYQLSVLKYDPKDATKQILVELAVDQAMKKFSFLSAERFSDPMDAIIAPSVVTALDVSAAEKMLGGFKVGEKVKITDIDRGRTEATLTVLRSEGGNESVRVSRVLFSNAAVLQAVENGKLVTAKVSLAQFGTLPVRLGLVQTGENEYLVASIRAEYLSAPITGFCGLKDLAIELGTKDVEVKSTIEKALRAARAKDSSFSCSPFYMEDVNGTGNVTSIYFENEKVSLSFEQRELRSVSTYLAPSEVSQ